MTTALQTQNGNLFPSVFWNDWPLERLLKQNPVSACGGSRPNAIAADIAEYSDTFIVSMDVPGMRHEDIDLSLEDTVLTVTVQRAEPAEQEDVRYHHRGRWHGKTAHSITLPDTASEEVEATLKDGVLTIAIKKQPEKQPRKIAIKTDE